MDSQRKWIWWLVTLSVVLAVLVWLVARYAGPPNAAFTSSASALAVIAGVAVGVERVLEAFWTVAGQMKGWWWPLGKVGGLADKPTAALDAVVKPFLDKAMDEVSSWPNPEQAKAKLREVRDSLNKLPKYVSAEQLSLLPKPATKAIESFLKVSKDDELNAQAEAALEAVAEVKTFAESFKDNPGKRIISIYVGVILGLVIAWALGLDLFQATLELQQAEAAAQEVAQKVAESGGEQGPYFPAWSIAVTGLIVGLGSSPTHEAIKLLTEWKKGLKA
jgi:hypothetical protein